LAGSRSTQGIQGLLGSSALGAFSVPLYVVLLVVGIRLIANRQWTFPLYLFIALSVSSLCAAFSGADDRTRQFQGLFLLPQELDLWPDDSPVLHRLRGHADQRRLLPDMLGAMYKVRTISYVILSAVAIKVKNERFHTAFAIFAAVFEILLIFKSYLTVPSLG
jgi:hypothetical protein